MPEPKEKQDKAEFKFEVEDGTPEFLKDEPVGCAIPNLNHGGREPQRRSGYGFKPSSIIFTKLKQKAKGK